MDLISLVYSLDRTIPLFLNKISSAAMEAFAI